MNGSGFFTSLYGGDNCLLHPLDSVCHQCARVSFFLSVVFPKWKVLVGVCVAVRLVHVMLDCVTKYMVWLCGGGAVFPSVCHRDLFM